MKIGFSICLVMNLLITKLEFASSKFVFTFFIRNLSDKIVFFDDLHDYN